MTPRVPHKMKLYPFDEVVANAQQAINNGATVHQQWNCEHCGAKQTMETPNTFYRTGTCEECKKVTNIEKAGHNFMVHFKTNNPAAVKHFLGG